MAGGGTAMMGVCASSLAKNSKRHLRIARANLGYDDCKACNMRHKDDTQEVESALLPTDGGGLCNAAGQHL